MTDKKEVEETIDIETAGNSVEVDMLGSTILSLAIRGDSAADYAIDGKLTRGSNWLQDVHSSTYSGSADYDDTIESGYAKLRVRCTTGTAVAGESATITLSAGGG